MKKILSVVLCVVMLLTLAVAANAEALNFAGGLKTDVTVKQANPAAVVKDGVIGAGEYEELIVNRDFDENSLNPSDLLLSYYTVELLEKAIGLAANVHFYYSWDEVHGINFAIQATLPETPYCEVEMPAPGTGDDFIWQFGMMASVVEEDDPSTKKNEFGNDVMNASVGYNTVTGTPLVGTWTSDGQPTAGLDGSAKNFEPRKDYFASVVGNVVTFEISYPISAVLPAGDRNGNIPNENALIYTNLSLVSGNVGVAMSEDIATHAVSVGDYGFMASNFAGDALTPAKTYFSHEMIPYNAGSDDTTTAATTPVATTEPETQIVTSVVTEEVVVTDDKGNEVTDESGNVVTEIVENVVSEVVTVAPSTTTPGAGTQAPTTGDPMIIAAVVAAISACGIVVAKKRK